MKLVLNMDLIIEKLKAKSRLEKINIYCNF